jgi:DNA polymerase I-like protein with 3'-5' exonuclease and polymerase domains
MIPSSLSDPTVEVSPSDFFAQAFLCGTMAVDTETTDIEKTDLRDGTGFAYGISAAVHLNSTYYATYFPVAHTKDNIDDTTKLALFNLISTRKRIIFHNAKFDIVALQTTGFKDKFGIGGIRYYCTMLMAHMLNENVPKGLDWLAKHELKEDGKNKPPDWELMFAIYGWSPDFPANIMAKYATEDAVLALKLFEKLYPYFVESGFDGPGKES